MLRKSDPGELRESQLRWGAGRDPGACTEGTEMRPSSRLHWSPLHGFNIFLSHWHHRIDVRMK